MPSNPQSVTELEDPGHLAHQRQEWIVERIGWGIMLLVIVTALAGLLGPGPLSRRTAGSRDGKLFIDYCGIERSQAPGELHFTLDPREASAGMLALRVGRSFLDEAKVQEIVPEPERVELAEEHCTYHFHVADAKSNGASEKRSKGAFPVTIRYEHDKFGRFEHEFAAGDERLRIVQWVLP